MIRNIYSKELAERLNVTMGTLHKKSFQRRIKLPVRKMGKRIFCIESMFNDWVINPDGMNKKDEQDKI